MSHISKFVLVLLALTLAPAISNAQCLDSTDVDNDGIIACEDNCPEVYNPWQDDFDGDGIGNRCDPWEGCCGESTGGFPGDINCGGDGKRGLADITVLIDHVYISKNSLCCFENGDVNHNGVINLEDITMLIDHVYMAKEEFEPCMSY